MSRTTYGAPRRQKRNAILKRAKGFVGGKSKLYRVAKNTVLKAEYYATRDRRARKGEFRSLWITRLSAALMDKGISYSKFIHALKLAKIELDRKSLSELAIHDAGAFDEVVQKAKQALVG